MTKPPHWMPPYAFVNVAVQGPHGIVHLWPAKRSNVAERIGIGANHMAWCGAEGRYVSHDLISNCIFCLSLSR